MLREPMHTFKHCIVTLISIEVSRSDPNAIVGEVRFTDLDTGQQHTASLVHPRGDPETNAKLVALQLLVWPKEAGRTRTPEAELECAIEFGGALRLVRFQEARRS